MQQSTMRWLVFATLLVALGTPPPATAVDLSGDYVVTVPIACRVTVVQTGTAIQTTGSCDFMGTPTSYSASGTVDPATGAFSESSDLGGVCTGVISGTGDGEVITATGTAPCYSGPITATKCGNGVIDPLENCDDGNQADGDCCSARCRLDPAGAVCTTDGNDSCSGLCDGAGTCTRAPVPPGKCRRAVASRDVARCMATQCDGIGREACRRHCKPAAIRTLAYAQSECREDASNHTYVAHQELRIRRGDRAPITVATFDSPRVADPLGFCPQWGQIGFGGDSVLAFPLQRLGVSPDGATIVYEVNDAAPFFPFGSLPPEQNGLFMVRADGTGGRRLGPPSADKSFRLGPGFGKPSIDLGVAYTLSPSIAFSPDGRRITFPDVGPALDGQQAVQIAVLDLVTGDRRLLTRLPAGTDPPTSSDDPLSAPFFLTCCPRFVDNDTIVFQSYTDPEGSRPTDLTSLSFFTIGIDGRHLTALPKPTLSPGAQLIPTFGVTGGRIALLRVSLPGTPTGPPSPPIHHWPITELFVQYGQRQLVQLTNYGRADTFSAFLTSDRKRAVFLASADPVRMNPHESCQLFSVDVHAGVPRQITHLDPGFPAPYPGCFAPYGIGYGGFRTVPQDPVTGTIIFDTTLDALNLRPSAPFGTVDQIFAIRPDGSGLRQLTEAPTGTHFPSTAGVSVEQPGPYAYSGASSSE
jgi:cysteine-rich repeat protein